MPRHVARLLASAVVLLLGLPAGAAATEVVPFGGATAHGAAPTTTGSDRVIGITATPSGGGYWQFSASGRVLPFGDAGFFGPTTPLRLNRPIVGMAASPSGGGYWLVASDGGVFSFGDARFAGSTGAMRLHRPIVGMAASPSGGGYWLVASDGGIFNFGDARFHGSAGGVALPEPVVGMAAAASGAGYLLATLDGRVLPFGAAADHGSLATACKPEPVVGIAARSGGGYWLGTSSFLPAAIPAGTHPIEIVAAESTNLSRLLRLRQGCQRSAEPRPGHLASPLPGSRMTSSYGERTHPIYGRRQFHAGVDLAGGTRILAAGDGVVVQVTTRHGYGLTTLIDHGDGVGTVYAHQSAAAVRVGDRVARGQHIGTVGRTGYATGDHLHFEVRRHGAPTDPRAWW